MSLAEFPWELDRIKDPEIDLSSQVGSSSEDHQHSTPSIVDDCLFVAVGKKVKENRSTVLWALRNSQGKSISLFHVHVPAQTIPYARYVSKEELNAYREEERKETLKVVHEYVQLCAKEGVNVDMSFFEEESIENGIVKHISENMIGNLVMGTTADNRYKKNMQLKSKKAIYVDSQAPMFCRILFVCKGHLFYTREGNYSLRSRSRIESEVSDKSYANDTDGCSYEFDRSSQMSFSDTSLPTTSSDAIRNELVVPKPRPPIDDEYQQKSMGEGDELYGKLDKLMEEADHLRKETFQESMKRLKAEKETFEAIRKAEAMESLYYGEQKLRKELEEKLDNQMNEKIGVIQKVKVSENLYLEEQRQRKELEEKLDKKIKENIEAIQKAKVMESLYFEEQKLRKELEEKMVEEIQEAIEEIRQAKVRESLYYEKYKQRMELEETRVKEIKEVETIKNQLDKALEELAVVSLQKSFLEREIEKSNLMVNELGEKILSSVALLEKYKEERIDLKTISKLPHP